MAVIIKPRLCLALALLVAFVCTLVPTCQAVLASPFPFTVTQPSGNSISLFLRGNEKFNWQEDAKGFTVVSAKDPTTGADRYMYARADPASGRLLSTHLEVGTADPESIGLTKHELPSQAFRGLNSTTLTNFNALMRRRRDSSRERRQLSGTVRNLVVMVRFADHVNRTLPSKSDLNTLFNNVGPHALCPTGSVRDVWFQNSYGKLAIESVLTDWITVNQTELYSSGGARGMTTVIHQALSAALAQAYNIVDFSLFDANKDGYIDMITFIHSGYGAEWGGNDAFGTNYLNRIWSHKWSLSTTFTNAKNVRVSSYHISPGVWGTSGSSIGRIGVIAHETGHYLGLPDLYDTDGSGAGIGSWGLMANSWGFDGSQYYPPYLSAWSKTVLNYVTPTIINASSTYYASAVAFIPQIFKITAGFPVGEYLLIENRQAQGFDAKMGTGAGLAIYHIDDKAGYNTQGWPAQTGWPANGNHYRVALLQADGLYQLESTTARGDAGDTWRVGGKTVLSPTSVPNTMTYQGGIVTDTGITITVLSAANATMAFRVDFAKNPASTCGAQNVSCPATQSVKTATACAPGYDCTVLRCCASTCAIFPAGTACDDGNALTLNDQCSAAGVCAGVAATTCASQVSSCTGTDVLQGTKACIAGSTCNANTCCAAFCAVNPTGTPCNDQNATTTNDVCTSGKCVGQVYVAPSTCLAEAIMCTGADIRLDAKACTPGTDCTYSSCCAAFCSVNPAGTACDDNDATTTADVCTSAGVCKGTPSLCGNQPGITCTATQVLQSNQVCTPGVNCDSLSCCPEFCAVNPAGTACEDNDPTTYQSTCNAAKQCVGIAMTCGNQNVQCAVSDIRLDTMPCTGSTCSPSNCCVNFCLLNAAGTPCDDLNSATVNDVCNASGQCAGTYATCGTQNVACTGTDVRNSDKQCTPGVSCNAITCCQAFCAVSPAGTPCNDFLAATVNDTCSAGKCVGVQATCANQGIVCTAPALKKTTAPSATTAKQSALKSVLKTNCIPGQTCTPTVCCPPTFGVKAVLRRVLSGTSYRYQATVTVTNSGTSALISGAKVTGTFTGKNWSDNNKSATTSAAGVVTLTTTLSWNKKTALDTTAKFCVTAITGVAGYNPLAAAVCVNVTP